MTATTIDLTEHELNMAVAHAENAAARLNRSADRINNTGVVTPMHATLRDDLGRARAELSAASRRLTRAVNDAELHA